MGFAEEVSAEKFGMGGEELVGVLARAVVDSGGDDVGPSFGQSGVELLGAGVNIACAFGSVE